MAYIQDPRYANNPGHYTRALLLILADLGSIFEHVEPSDEGKTAFSYRIHALPMRTCIEIEANFKAIFDANTFSSPTSRSLTIRGYRKIDVTHHLSSYEAMLPIWNGTPPTIKPFEAWRMVRGQTAPNGAPLTWYQAYNASKHSRQNAFRQANLWTLIEAIAGLLIIITSQFKDVIFDAGPTALLVSGLDYHDFEHSIGGVFRIKYPDDWSDNEIYEFNWSSLKSDPNPFDKINYDAIPA